MPDKRDMHQAKSHRSNKRKNQTAPGKARNTGSVRSDAARAEGDVPMTVPMSKKNKSKR